MPGKTSRRHFIQGACTIAGITLLPAQCLAWESQSDTLEHGILQSVAQLLTEHDLAVRIGQQYIRGSNRPRSRSELVRWLQERIAVGSGTDENIFRKIETSILSDFSDDKIVVMQGWWLSETEVRLCALAAVTATDFT
jgi:hypothetical protein